MEMRHPPPGSTQTNSHTRFLASILVGCSVFLYFAIAGHTSFLETTAYGILAAMLTHIASRAQLTVAIVAVLALTFFVARALRPDPELPGGEPGADTGIVKTDSGTQNQGTADGTTPEPPKASDSDDPLAEQNRLSPNNALLARFEGKDRPFIVRLLAGELTTIQDEGELETIQAWVEHVRAAQTRMTERKRTMERLESLDGCVEEPVILFELGLLDGPSYHPPKTEHRNITERERLEAAMGMSLEVESSAIELTSASHSVQIYRDGTSNAPSRGDTGEPQPPQGMVMLVSPRCHGYTFIHLAELLKMKAPSLTSDAVRNVVRRYAQAAKDGNIMKSWGIITTAAPHPNAFFMMINNGRDPDLEAIEDAVLAGDVRGTSAQQLARHYAAYESAIEEYEDFIAHQQRVARLVRFTLTEAHKTLRATEARERAQRIAAREANKNGTPYEYLNTDRTPVKTRAQRRLELEALVLAAVPTTRRQW